MLIQSGDKVMVMGVKVGAGVETTKPYFEVTRNRDDTIPAAQLVQASDNI